MDAAPPPVPEEPPARDWSLLLLDVLSSIFVKLGAVDVLTGAGLVCLSWLDAAKVPDVWRVVDTEKHKIVPEYLDSCYMLKKDPELLCVMAKAAVDRSGGQLREFAGKRFVTEELMEYIVQRSPSLTTLRLVSCWKIFGKRLAGVIRESPLSEFRELELDNVDLTVEELTAVLENCPALEVLTVCDCSGMDEEDENTLREKFPRIMTLTFECDDVDFAWYEYDLSDFGSQGPGSRLTLIMSEDERTD